MWQYVLIAASLLVFAHMRALDELQQANPNVATQTTFVWHDPDNDKFYRPGEVNLNPNGGNFVSTNLQGGGLPPTASPIPTRSSRTPMSSPPRSSGN